MRKGAILFIFILTNVNYMYSQGNQYIPIDSTCLEFKLPEGYAKSKVYPSSNIISITYKNNDIGSSFDFYLTVGVKPNKQIKNFEEYAMHNLNPSSHKILKKIEINNDIECTNMYLTANKYSPIDINYEYNFFVFGEDYFIVATCTFPDFKTATAMESAFVESFSSIREKH